MSARFRRRLLTWLALLPAVLMVACASLPPTPPPRPESGTLVAGPETPLGAIAGEAGVPAGRTGVRALPASAYALDARLTLLRQARVSLDVQTYLIGNDSTGRLLLRELRDAAARGVRVRLLLDDLYTNGTTELLQGLAAYPNIELRLFNPFAYGRDHRWLKSVNLLADFSRLNHRMHNKLFVADGVAAIVGGRNLADDYFFRSREGNFIDFELLAVGALVPQLSRSFDQYWNSDLAWPLQAVTPSSLEPAERRARFDLLTDRASTPEPAPPATVDPSTGLLPLSLSLPTHRHGLFIVDASCYADPPSKAGKGLEPGVPTVMSRFVDAVHQASSDVVIFSPYFIPGERGMEQLRQARAAGIDVAVVTNALGASDEPLVSVGYGRYREAMLRMGVQLFEISSARLKRDHEIGRMLGSSIGRLHAKVAIVDNRLVMLGSMNMDARSARINTELGVAVRSPEFTRQVAAAMRVHDRRVGVFEVRLKADGKDIEWVARDADGEQTLSDEPEASLWQRFVLKMMSVLIPEELL